MDFFPEVSASTSPHRSIFLILRRSAPAAAVSLSLLWLVLPPEPSSDTSLVDKVRRIDYLGAFLVLSSTVLLVTALEQGGTGYSWRSALVLSLLIFSIILLAGSILHSWSLRHRNKRAEPVLAWNLLSDRFAIGLFLNAFFGGSAFLAAIVVLPLQFQVVYQDTASGSGYRLLCLTLVSPLFSGVAGFLTQRKHTPPLYTLLAGQSLTVIGSGLASSLHPEMRTYPVREYGYQTIMGAGFGLC